VVAAYSARHEDYGHHGRVRQMRQSAAHVIIYRVDAAFSTAVGVPNS
jgi:hypothetical protein